MSPPYRESGAVLDATGRMLARAASIRWLYPDAATCALDAVATDVVRACIARHFDALAAHAPAVSRVRHEVHFTRSATEAFARGGHDRLDVSFGADAIVWLDALETAYSDAVAESFARHGGPECARVSTAAWSALVAHEPRGYPGGCALDAQVRWQLAFESAGDRPSPWLPLFDAWEHGVCLFPTLDAGVIAYVPARDAEGNLLLEPGGERLHPCSPFPGYFDRGPHASRGNACETIVRFARLGLGPLPELVAPTPSDPVAHREHYVVHAPLEPLHEPPMHARALALQRLFRTRR